ncbi:MAG: hypothetical protein AB1411_10245 [Nitrospirota bacterium]
MTIIYALAGAIGLVIGLVFLLDAIHRARVRQAQRTGLYPPAGQGTDQDVERLAVQGQKVLAIRLYRELHDTDLKTAKEAVDKIVKQSPLKGHYRS